jgi:pimeloyl-ACP methyl ester carboxylesterase
MKSGLARLTTRAGSVVDGAVLHFIERAMAREAAAPPRDAGTMLASLGETYGRAEHFERPDTYFIPPPPARMRARHVEDLPGGGALVDLAWPSAHVPFLADYREEFAAHAENGAAYARWWRSARPRTTIVLLHGWGGGPWFLESRAFPVDYFRKLGLDVILFQLPFHGLRTPRGTRSGQLFPSPHVVRTNESFAQAISDLRALHTWLLEQDVPAIGLSGMSLGGYTTALYASLVKDVAFAAPMIPAVSIAELMWRHGDATAARRRAVAAGVTQALLEAVFRVHAPLERQPLVPRDRRFIIAGRGDRITPPDQAEKLWRHWEQPTLHWFPGGHLAQVGRGDAFRAMGKWLRGIL